LGYDPDVVGDAARLAAEICEVRVAWIGSLNGKVLNAIASAGLGPAGLEIPAELVDRLHRTGPVLVVPDILQDPGLGLAIGPELGLRFVALAMLTGKGGAGLGLILVGDQSARDLPADRAEALGAVARLVSAHLELRATIGRLEHAAAERRRYEQHLEEYQLRLERDLAEILEQSITDPLTGLRNRRAFLERLDDEIRHFEAGGPPVAVVLLDVDGFKPYNDSFGHPAGDQVLKRIAELFRERIRSNDVLARIGGDEFAVLLPGTDAEGGYVLAERLRRSVEDAPWDIQRLTVSAGAAAVTDSPVDRDDLISAADRALYEAKTSGRNRVWIAG
jgi:diguanylate cyclase (GGDEF)-like protein